MLFNSYIFLFLFLPLALAGFYLVGRFGRRPAAAWLAVMSLVFYAWWNPAFVVLLLISIAFNFGCAELTGALSSRPRLQGACLAGGIAVNLAALVYYKYFAALLAFANGFAGVRLAVPDIVLPLGISFFTFTQIGYLVDVRQGTAKERGLLNYVLFVTFFPHLIAGPILHNGEIMPQFEDAATYRPNGGNFAAGLSLFVIGLAKKCLLADPLSATVGAGFAGAAHSPLFAAWNTALAYSLQLYFDFSGYSDMAIGIARMFNVQFPLNFNSPYKATSIIDFWQRWHITLTRYLTLYVYTPVAMSISRRRAARGLGISRAAQSTPSGFAAMVAFPVFVTMLLAGAWHGAGSQFLVFGVLHAVFLTVNHAWRLFRPRRGAAPGRRALLGGFALTFLCALLARIFFRAPSVPAALGLLGGMAGLHGIEGLALPGAALAPLGAIGRALLAHGVVVPVRAVDAAGIWTQVIWLAVLYAAVFGLPNSQQIMARAWPALGVRHAGPSPFAAPAPTWLGWRPTRGWGVAIGAVAAVSLLAVGGTAEFLYFQF
jgi:alginate O-acetyltransferase complex protein AlgI